jgi:predicted nucleic acid-binding protein
MTDGSRCAVDTNILLRLLHPGHSQHGLLTKAILSLVSSGIDICFAPQNLGEFWNVATRPLERNGMGLSTEEAKEHILSIESRMTLLPESEEVYHVWRRLLFEHEVRGVQVHDAHLAAVLEVHGISRLLTLNGRDFKRFSGVVPVHPQEIVTS